MTRQTAPASPRIVVTRRPRSTAPLGDIDKALLEYISNWRIAKKAGEARDKANKTIKSWFTAGVFGDRDVTINDNGSQILRFNEPKEIDGAKFIGVENRRTVTPELDLDRVDAWIASLPKAKQDEVRAKLYKKVVVEEFDADALYAMQQGGALSEDTLDGFFENKIAFALCVVKD